MHVSCNLKILKSVIEFKSPYDSRKALDGDCLNMDEERNLLWHQANSSLPLSSWGISFVELEYLSGHLS